MFKLCFFVPESHLEQTKRALFEVGAGRIGDYDCCAWQTLGQGQFRPLDGSQPFLGERGELEVVSEYKVELVCEDGLVARAVEALKAAHPYEEPAYEVYRLEELP
ncbi:MAG: YqfO family protein [Pseudomonadales bacterium]|nr:YqfO family protein [Pseudomonadales bacterium]